MFLFSFAVQGIASMQILQAPQLQYHHNYPQQQFSSLPVGCVPPNVSGGGNVTHAIVTPQGGHFVFQPMTTSMSTFVCKYKQAKEGIVVCSGCLEW